VRLLDDRRELVGLTVSAILAFGGSAAREDERAGSNGEDGSDGGHCGGHVHCQCHRQLRELRMYLHQLVFAVPGDPHENKRIQVFD
jgi:hypothetical protein